MADTRTNFYARAALAVAAAVSFCSCGAPGAARPGEGQSAQPAATPTPVPAPQTAAAAASASPAADEEPYVGEGIKIVPVEIKEINERLGYDLDISYPQIDNPQTPHERGFNRRVKKMIERDVREFRAFCAKNKKYPDGTERRGEFHMGATYVVLYAAPELLSVLLTMESFTGYVNADWYPVPLNYDLKTGRELKLSHLFKPGAKYLEALSAYSVAEFGRVGLNCGGDGIGNEHWMREGTAPKADNYSSWSLTPSGIQINFGEYQVGPGCLGLRRILVPYAQLKDILRDDGPARVAAAASPTPHPSGGVR